MGYGKARFLRMTAWVGGKCALFVISQAASRRSCCSSRSWPDLRKPRRSPSTRLSTPATRTWGMESADRWSAGPLHPAGRDAGGELRRRRRHHQLRHRPAGRRRSPPPRRCPASRTPSPSTARPRRASLALPIVELVGPAGGATAGLTITGAASSGTVIRGLVINRVHGGQRQRDPHPQLVEQRHRRQLPRHEPRGHGGERQRRRGLHPEHGRQPRHRNRIGGTVAADRNVISGNSDDGIQIDGAGARQQPRAGQLHRPGRERDRRPGERRRRRRHLQQRRQQHDRAADRRRLGT